MKKISQRDSLKLNISSMLQERIFIPLWKIWLTNIDNEILFIIPIK
jgi:hypothetical protein